MTAWLATAPALLALAVLWFGPGLAVGALLGLRGVRLLGVAPALSLTIVAGGAVLAPYLHLRFTPLTVVAMTALAALGAGLVGRLLARGTGRQTAPAASSATGGWSGTGMVLAVAALTALAIGWPAVTGIGSPGELVDSPDAVFHLNRLRLYLDSGNASSLLVGYPSGFHDLAAVVHQVTGTPLDVLVNLTALSAAVLVWPVSLLCLAWAAFRGNRAAIVGTGVAAAIAVVFPSVLLGWGVLWPNLLGQAALPGVLTLSVLVVRERADARRTGVRAYVTPETVALTAGLPGLGLAHPNAVVALILFALAGGVTVFGARLVTGPDRGRAAALLVTSLVLPPLAAFALARISPQLATAAAYTWAPDEPVTSALVRFVSGAEQNRPAWTLALLMALGAAALWRRRLSQWLVTAYLACLALYLLAATTTGPVTALLTGFWYSDRVRIAALAVVPGTLLAGAGFAVVVRALRTWGPPLVGRPWWSAILVVAAAVATATSGLTAGTRFDRVHDYYYPDDATHTILTATDRTDLLALVAPLPLDVMVVGDPSNGSGLLYALTGRPVLLASIGATRDPAAVLVGEHLAEVAARADVCAALVSLRAGYAVDTTYSYWGRHVPSTVGLVGLAGRPGFTAVASAGKYTLYRITACPGLQSLAGAGAAAGQ